MAHGLDTYFAVDIVEMSVMHTQTSKIVSESHPRLSLIDSSLI